jgi:hypothetical protein
MRMKNAMKKSISGERIPEIGITSRGKYTFVIIAALVTMLVVERVSPSEKSVQGMSAAKLNRG